MIELNNDLNPRPRICLHDNYSVANYAHIRVSRRYERVDTCQIPTLVGQSTFRNVRDPTIEETRPAKNMLTKSRGEFLLKWLNLGEDLG